MINYVKLGMMMAEWRDACRAIDARASEAFRQSLQSGFQAILAGDALGRDRHCATAERVSEAQQRAKLEAGLRIGEKYGFDRDDVLMAMRKHGERLQ